MKAIAARLNTILFFVPFLFLLRRRSREWLGCFFLPPLLFVAWLLFSLVLVACGLLVFRRLKGYAEALV